MELLGPQIRQYFNFLRFIILTNLVFFLLTLISFVPHVSKTTDMLKTVGASLGQGSSTSTSKLDILFLSSYQPSSDGAWTAMVALCSILSFLTGPMYILASTYIFKDYIGASERNLSAEDDVIEDNRDQTAGYNLRLIINYLLFCVCCGVPALIMYVMFESIAKSTMQQSYDRGAEAGTNAFSEVLTLVYALVPSAIVSLSNIAFASVVDMLNRWDKHPTWSKYRNHRLFKILGFRIVNVMCLFVFKYFSDVPFYTCVTRRISFQVFTFMLPSLCLPLADGPLVRAGRPRGGAAAPADVPCGASVLAGICFQRRAPRDLNQNRRGGSRHREESIRCHIWVGG